MKPEWRDIILGLKFWNAVDRDKIEWYFLWNDFAGYPEGAD
jgi:hypothetical protein